MKLVHISRRHSDRKRAATALGGIHSSGHFTTSLKSILAAATNPRVILNTEEIAAKSFCVRVVLVKSARYFYCRSFGKTIFQRTDPYCTVRLHQSRTPVLLKSGLLVCFLRGST